MENSVGKFPLTGNIYFPVDDKSFSSKNDNPTPITSTLESNGVKEEAAIKIQSHLRGYYSRKTNRYPLKFTVWRNMKDPNKPEHTTLKFGKGEKGRYVDFRQGSRVIPNISSVETKNVLTGKMEAKPFWILAYDEHTSEEHKERYLGRPSLPSDAKDGKKYRYDAKETFGVSVNIWEHRLLRNVLEERKKKGVFHLYGEAAKVNPFATRCLTLLEVLADRRKQKLEQDNCSIMLRNFKEENPATVSASKLKLYRRKEEHHEDNPLSPERIVYEGRLDKAYWERHKNGEYNVNLTDKTETE